MARTRFFRAGPLLHQPDFRRIIVGQGSSAVGSQITKIAIPTVAIVSLHASVQAAALLFVAETLVEALTGPLLGVVVDRLSLVPLMVGADIARGIGLATVPLAAAFGALTMAHLYALMLVTGLCTALFDISMSKTLPGIFQGDSLVKANAALGGLRSTANTGGPMIAGVMIQLIGASRSVLLDTVTYFWSAQRISGLTRQPSAPRTSQTSHRMRAELQQGLRAVRARPDIIRLMIGSGIMNFASIGIESMLLYYAYRDLSLHPFLVGLVYTCYGLGLLVGYASAPGFYRRYPTRTIVRLGATTAAASFLLVPLANSLSLPAVPLIAHELAFGAAAAVWGVGSSTLLQTAAPPELLGRVAAVSRSIAVSILPFGVLTASLLAAAIGIQATLWTLAGTALLAPVTYFSRTFAPSITTARET